MTTWVRIEVMVRVDEELPTEWWAAPVGAVVVRAVEDALLPNGEGEVTRMTVEKVDRPELET